MRPSVLLSAFIASAVAAPNYQELDQRAIVTLVQTVVDVYLPNGQLYTKYTVGVKPTSTGGKPPVVTTTTKRVTTTTKKAATTTKKPTTKPTTPASAPTGITIPSYAKLDLSNSNFANDAVDRHNLHRSNHSANAVTYNNTVARWAAEKAVTCLFNEDMPADAKGVGMNLALGTNNNAKIIKTTISGLWYNDEFGNFPGYGIANPPLGNFEHWGHFTQVVWKGSQQIGCAVAQCSRKDGTANAIGAEYYTVCMYYPPGNYLGQFNTGVGRPKGAPIAR